MENKFIFIKSALGGYVVPKEDIKYISGHNGTPDVSKSSVHLKGDDKAELHSTETVKEIWDKMVSQESETEKRIGFGKG